MIKTLKYVVLIVLVLFTAAFILLEYKTILQECRKAFTAFYLVVLIGVFTYLVILSKRLVFFENLVHEGTHLIFALLTFQKVSNLYVSSTNGVVFTEGTEKGILVTISPYFFPLVTVMLICLFNFYDFRYSKHIIMVSYCLYLAVTIRNLFKEPSEIISAGITGWILLLVLNFWVGYFIMLWCIP